MWYHEILNVVHWVWDWSGKLRQPLGLFFMLWPQQGDNGERQKKKLREDSQF